MPTNYFNDLQNSALGKMLTGSAASTAASGATQSDYDRQYQSTFGGSNYDPTIGGALSSGFAAGISGALPTGLKQDIQSLSDFRLGTFLRTHGKVSGNVASIIDGSIDFIRSGNKPIAGLNNFNPQTYSTKFIPVIIKTEFPLDNGQPLYVVFDTTPDSFSFTRSANWAPKDFLGRPDPVQVFSGNSAITFNLRGMFFSDHPKDHNAKIALSDKLFSLVTPSKKHFMPTPVYVRIGEWKTLRCVTTNVTVEYKGPWWTNPKVDTSATTAVSIPSYTPYLYEASFTFTVTPAANNVKYAEDIISTSKFEPSLTTEQFNTATLTSLIYTSTVAGDFNNITEFGVATSGIGIQNYTSTVEIPDAYMKSIQAAYAATGTNSKLGGLAQITSGIGGIVQQGLGTIISKSKYSKYIK